MNHLAQLTAPRAVRFDPDARQFAAYHLAGTRLLGNLNADTLDGACAEATDRWHWDRGDRLGIREQGQEDAPLYPFDKQPVDRLHIYAIRKSAPIRWELTRDNMRTKPVCKFSLDHICTVDLRQIRGEAK